MTYLVIGSQYRHAEGYVKSLIASDPNAKRKSSNVWEIHGDTYRLISDANTLRGVRDVMVLLVYDWYTRRDAKLILTILDSNNLPSKSVDY